MSLISSLILSVLLLNTTGFKDKRTEGSSKNTNAERENIPQDSEFKRIKSPVDIPNLLTFWDFQEESGSKKKAKGKYKYELEEMNGPIRRVEDGVFGKYSADLEWGQWLRLKRADAQGLNIHGSKKQITIVSWIQRQTDRPWQYIAGMWNEGDMKFLGKAEGTGDRYPARQYALFMSGLSQTDYTTYKRSPAMHQAMGYLSPFGGATPNHPFAFDYATGKTFLEKDKWYMIAYTYDTKWISVYVNGALDTNANFNPFHYEGPIFDGGPNGADFTVAQRDHPMWPTYPEGKPTYEEGFDGKLGGLAVYDRALTAKEITALYQATLGKK
jgi:hypothetical protein